MKKILRKISALVLTLAMLVCTAPSALAGSLFPDVDDDAPYSGSVAWLTQLGIFKGDESGNFNPDGIVTRADFATIICRVLCAEEDAQNMVSDDFTDVPAEHWANGYVAEAVSLGIVNGYGGSLFGPEDPVTYEQAVKMTICALELGEDAEAAGGYPDGYIAVARELADIDSVPASVGQALPRGAVAILLACLI